MKVVAFILGVIALVAVAWFIAGWLIMIGAGILFNAGVVPASLGWQDAFWLGAIASVFFGGATATNAK